MRPRCFIDFDRTIFDTEYANQFFLNDAARLVGVDAVTIAYASLQSAQFSFARFVDALQLPPEKVAHYSEHMRQHGRLYKNVVNAFTHLSSTHDIVLLTYGDDAHQKLKLESVAHLLPTFHAIHVIQNDITKGDVVATYPQCEHDIFIDDLPNHLISVRNRAPWVKLFRAMHPPSKTATSHEYDNIYWTTFDDFQKLLL